MPKQLLFEAVFDKKQTLQLPVSAADVGILMGSISGGTRVVFEVMSPKRSPRVTVRAYRYVRALKKKGHSQ